MIVEFFLVASTFLFLIFSTISWGYFLWVYATISLAVTETARCAAVTYNLPSASGFTSPCSADFTKFLKSYAIGVDTSGMTISTSFSDATCFSGAKTTVSYTFTLPFVGYSIPVTETACFPLPS